MHDDAAHRLRGVRGVVVSDVRRAAERRDGSAGVLSRFLLSLQLLLILLLLTLGPAGVLAALSVLTALGGLSALTALGDPATGSSGVSLTLQLNFGTGVRRGDGVAAHMRSGGRERTAAGVAADPIRNRIRYAYGAADGKAVETWHKRPSFRIKHARLRRAGAAARFGASSIAFLHDTAPTIG